jgi:hypothetical protein
MDPSGSRTRTTMGLFVPEEEAEIGVDDVDDEEDEDDTTETRFAAVTTASHVRARILLLIFPLVVAELSRRQCGG